MISREKRKESRRLKTASQEEVRNFLDGTKIGHGGVVYAHRTGFCLESGHYPDSPNHPDFPTTVLNPGETFNSQTIYRFSVR